MIRGQITRMLLLSFMLMVTTTTWSADGGEFILLRDTVPQDTIPAQPSGTGELQKEAPVAVDTVSGLSADTIPSGSNRAMADPEPRIIYYQSDEADRYRQNNVSYNERGGKRVKTLAGSTNHSGGFGAISFKSTSFNDEAMVMAGVRGGWIVNRTLAIGGEGYGIIPTAKLDGIDPDRQVLALGGYGGLFLELILFSNEVVHVTFPVGGGAGWLGYDPVDEGSSISPPFDPDGDGLVDEDVFWYVEPGADLELNVARNFRLVVGASKRFTQDLEILNTRDDALEKWNFFVTLKIGSF